MATDSPMQLGMVGLGRMGANIVRRIMRGGHKAVVYDVSADAVSALEADGADGSTDLATFVQKMERPRNVWIMVPAGKITESVITQLADLLEPGDAIIDGGNSYYHDDIRHAANLKDKGIELEVTEGLLDHLGTEGFDPVFGARPLKRAIQQRIENPLSKQLLEGKFPPKTRIEVSVDPVRNPGVFDFAGQAID